MKPFSLLLPAFWSIGLHLLLLMNSLWFFPNTTAIALGNETDHLALLKFKELVSRDPYEILASWNSSTHFCNWHGITCTPTLQRVAELNLAGYQLNGSISPHVGNLSFLTGLNLENNSFSGKIPQELGRLLQLKKINFYNNSLTGEFPTNLTSCFQLKFINLERNNLIGKIPIEIGSLLKLRFLNLMKNKLSGGIPASIGNLSSLHDLGMGENHLEGNIPQEIGHLKNLSILALHVNNLSGNPFNVIYNLSSLTIISIPSNLFYGSLPSKIISPKLVQLDIADNQFSGPIPNSIRNASALQYLEISVNNFTGHVPSLGNLQDLSVLNLESNNLGSNSIEDLEFLKSMTNCSKLQVISIFNNSFGGHLPKSLGNLSNQLTELYLGSNQISGKIPMELGNLNNLILLTMEYNYFEGNIPSAFGTLQKIQEFDLSDNKLSGDIPAFIGNLTQLFYLGLRQNMFKGNIPSSIGNCQMLQFLDLSKNYLRGTIPLEVFSLSSLTNLLDLSQNSLSGSMPKEVGILKSINILDVTDNHLTDDIPPTIGECTSLEYLFLGGNSFDGFIPSSLGSIKGLRHLDLSQNHLHGSIPKTLQNISVLEYLNVSFNMLEGEVPTEGVFQNASGLAVTGNNKLCGGIPKLHLPPCLVKGQKPQKHHYFKLIAVIVSAVACLLIFSFILTIYWMKRRNKKSSSDSPTVDQLAKISYQNLHQATNGFSARNLIGCGSFGSVYKGTLVSEDKVVAIKVLNLQKKGANKSFIVECNALRNIRHRNLVKILTCCSSTDYKHQEFKALVFEFMTNGSLENWLHPIIEETTDKPISMSLEQRLSIITDVASAFHYLHYECEQVIIHCDLKPSNILLDDDMVAHVSDFGLARLLSSIGVSLMQSSTVGIKGTIGYAPPEYGMGYDVSIEGDMYSFGILVLEMLTGKRPTDEMFKDELSLHNHVKFSISNHLLQTVDPSILPNESELAIDNESLGLIHPNVEKCLVSLFKIGLACSVESPKERMTMVDVTRELNKIKSFFPFVV